MHHVLTLLPPQRRITRPLFHISAHTAPLSILSQGLVGIGCTCLVLASAGCNYIFVLYQSIDVPA